MGQYSDLEGVSLIGNKEMSMDSNFLSGNAFISDGRMIIEGEKEGCVISAEQRNRKLKSPCIISGFTSEKFSEIPLFF